MDLILAAMAVPGKHIICGYIVMRASALDRGGGAARRSKPNRAGDEHGRQHIGKSMVVSPLGAEVLATAKDESDELLVATLDLDDVATAQKSLPWWRDRRPDLYGRLVRG